MGLQKKENVLKIKDFVTNNVIFISSFSCLIFFLLLDKSFKHEGTALLSALGNKHHLSHGDLPETGGRLKNAAALLIIPPFQFPRKYKKVHKPFCVKVNVLYCMKQSG